MKARSRAAKVAIAVLAALLVAACAVVVAVAKTGTGAKSSTVTSAKKRHGGHPPSRTIHAMCVYDGSHMLRYTRKASRCNEDNERAIKLPSDGPLMACEVMSSHAARARSNGKRPYPNVRSGARVGSLFLANRASDCHSGEKPLRLSPKKRTLFCVELHDGGEHVVDGWKACRRWEFAAALPAHHYKSQHTNGNGDVIARDDQSSSDEDAPKNVDVLGNDDGAGPLHVKSVDTSGMKGQASKNSDGTVTWAPNGKFESLGAGQSATDVFHYTASDTHSSDSAKVTMKVTGRNDAPKASADNGSTDENSTVDIAVLSNDNDPDNGDTLSVGSVNTAGTQGQVTVSSGGDKVTYDPNGQFSGLAKGQTATDKFRYRAKDSHGADSNEAQVAVKITGVGDPPSVATSSGDTAYSENDPATTIDGGLTVSDPDDTNFESAKVKVSPGTFAGSDRLDFTDELGISGSYDTSTGVLSLTGTAPKGDYQQALRDVKYRSTSDDPASSKSIEFTVNDGDQDSQPATKNVAITAVNDAPTMDNSSGSASFTEGGSAATVDPNAALSDPDSTQIQGATVAITSNFSSSDGDTLNFTNTPNISGSYNSATGILTLSGSDTVASYQAALRSITFSNTSDNPSTATRAVSFQATDSGSAASNTDSRNVTVAGSNDAPVMTTTGGSTPVAEGSSAAVDGGLTVSDVDDTNLESAQVRVSSGFQAGDHLDFTDTPNITGSYDSGTGVLTLNGTDTVANYQAALRSVQFGTTNDNPSASRAIEFKANDGSADSNAATKGMSVSNVNDAPTMDNSSGSAAYTEDGAAATVDPSATISDPDSANLQGATVAITTNFSSADGDTLNFTNTANISGSYNSATGILTLSGADTLAAYRSALRSITFSNTSNNPSTATRTVSFQVTDAEGASSNTDSRDVTVAASNDAPVVTTSSGSTSYSEQDPATAIDGSLTVSDADNANLASAQVRISSGFQPGDDLQFTDTANISGSYNSSTGVLTLTGTDTVANYQAALRSVKYAESGDNPSTSKTVAFKVNDGTVDSAEATKGLTITPVNDAPTVATTSGNASYTEGGSAATVDPGATLTDPDSTNMQGATVSITTNFSSSDGDTLNFTNTASISGSYNSSTGVLTLSGADTVANYQAALRSVTFSNTSDDPSTATRTVSFKATDAEGADSNSATRDVSVSRTNDAPTVTTSSGSTSYSEGDPATTIDGSLTVTDPDDTNLESAKVKIATGLQPADALEFADTATISGSYASGTGVLTLTGTDTVANYQAALRSVKYVHNGDNPSASKSIEFTANDGDVDSAAATKTIDVTGVNDGPTLTTTAAALGYAEGDGAVAADNGLTLTDPEGDQITGATVAITSNFVQADDDLSFTDTTNISGSYDDTTGILTLSGTDSVANYQAALRSVKFTNVSQNPSGSKTVSFQTTGDTGSPSQASNTASRNINLTNVDDAPVVTTSGGSTSWGEGDSAVVVDSGVTVSDVDDTNIDSAQVRISSGFQSGDALEFTNTATITGNYTPGTGVLTLSGSDTVANYQAALQSIKFETSNDNPSSPKTVEFKVNDGDADSNAPTKNISITGVNDAPTLTTSSGTANYTENSSPSQIDAGLTLSDPDSTQIQSAKVSITSNFTSADGDTLSFTDTANITGSYNSGTGVLTLSGPDTVANYQAALASVTYSNTSENPSNATRTISFQAKDAEGGDSNTATRDVTVTPVNDAPVVTPTTGSTAYTEGDAATVVDSGVTVSDVDDTNLVGGTVKITSGLQNGDSLQFTNTATITGNYDSGTGTLTLSGSDTVANYQSALQSVKFVSTNNNPVTSKTVEFKVGDGDVDSNAPTKEIAVTPVNSPPQVNATDTSLGFTENDPATAVDGGLTVTEPESDNLSGASVEITANYQAGEDFLAWTDNDGSDNITLDNVNTTSKKVVLTGLDTAAHYQAALRAVTYQDTSENPSSATRTVTFSATDSPGGATGSDTRGIAVTPVDDPPTAVNDPGGAVTNAQTTVLEDASATAIPVLNNDTDVDGGAKTISTATDPANGTVVLTGGSPGAHTGLTYQPDPNYCNSPDATASATPDTFTYTLNGGSNATVSMTVTCVNDAPVAGTDNFTAAADKAVGNTTFVINDPADSAPATPDPTDTSPVTDRPHKTVNSNVRSNDSDVDGPGPLIITAVGTDGSDGNTNDGGTVSVAPNGHDIVYEPKAGTSCTDQSDTFKYTLSDQNPGTPGTALGTVNVDLTGCVWYVNNDDADGSSGTSAKPFDSLTDAQNATPGGDTVYVYKGASAGTPYSGGITLDANQRLIGQVADLSEGSDTLHSGDSGKRPTLTNSNADVVTLDDGNTLRGLAIDPNGTTQGGGIAAVSTDANAADNNGTIDDVNITDTGTSGIDPGLELNGTTGTWNISSFSVDTSGATSPPSTEKGVYLNGAGTVNFADTGTISLNTKGAAALDADTTNMGTGSVFDSIAVSGSGSGGVRLFNLGAGSNTTLGNLNLATTSGSTAALLMSSARTVSVPSAGTDNISATGGPAIDTTGTTGVSLNMDDVDSTNSTGNGIRLDGLGTGTFSSNSSSTIAGAAGTAFNVSGASSGSITFPGTIGGTSSGAGDGTGQSVSITGRTGGSVTMSGPISDSSDSGGGITVSANSGGNTDFTNSTKTINTTTSAGAGNPINNAVVLSGNTGHTVNFTGGGLDIDSFGTGLSATSGGTVTVTDPAATPSSVTNSINSTSGVALTVTGTTIGANGMKFHDVSAGNNTAATDPANGILLNGTGSSGSLTVVGGANTSQGGDNSGGTIQNVTGDAIRLGDTTGPSFDDMQLASPAHSGIEGFDSGSGNGPHNFTFKDGKISSAGQSAANDVKDGAIVFNQFTSGTADDDNVDGTVTIDKNVVTSPYGRGFDIDQRNGTISNLSMQGNSLTSDNSTTTSKSHGIEVTLTGADSGGGVASLSKATVDSNTVTGFPNGHGISMVGGNIATTAASGTGNTMGTPDGNPNNGADTNAVKVTNNVVQGYSGATRETGNVIQIDFEGRGQANFYVVGNGTVANPLTNSKLQPLGIGIGGTVTVDGTFKDNVITSTTDDNGAAGIGATTGERIVAGGTALDGATANLEFNNNDVTASSGPGLNVVMLSQNATEKTRIENNTLANPLQPATAGMRVQVGSNTSNASEVPTMCSLINANTVGTGPTGGGGFQVPGINLYAFQPSADFKLAGFAGGTNTQAETYVAGNNPNSASGGGTAFVGQKVAIRTGTISQGCTVGF